MRAIGRLANNVHICMIRELILRINSFICKAKVDRMVFPRGGPHRLKGREPSRPSCDDIQSCPLEARGRFVLGRYGRGIG
jgi:hypothetical protein